jgi:hypothetical protein
VWAILGRFGQVYLDEPSGNEVQRLEIIITMDSNKRDMFNHF